MKPKIISISEIHQGKVFDLVSATIRENGKEYDREIIRHVGSAVIVPVFEDNSVGLVRQYRHAAGEYLLELPAGTLEKGETPMQTAFREVEEEIGFKASKMEQLTKFYVSPGFLDEIMHVFLATGLSETEQNLDEDEVLTVVRITFPEAYSKIASGEIRDAKTMVGLILAGKRFGVDF